MNFCSDNVTGAAPEILAERREQTPGFLAVGRVVELDADGIVLRHHEPNPQVELGDFHRLRVEVHAKKIVAHHARAKPIHAPRRARRGVEQQVATAMTAVAFYFFALSIVIRVGGDEMVKRAEQERSRTHRGVKDFDIGEFGNFRVGGRIIFVAEQGFGLGEDGFGFFAERVGDEG